MAVADETAQILEYSTQLEFQSQELSRTARQLKEANEKLTDLSVQKDAFLSQISHELRTPMTSIRAFSEILRDAEELSEDEQHHYSSIIHEEAIRLTRLLDDLLDLSVLERGTVTLDIQEGNIAHLIDKALNATSSMEDGAKMVYLRDRPREDIQVTTDTDRLSQVFINLVANARKYCDAPSPKLTISVRQRQGMITADFIDNGSGIPTKSQEIIFEKFSRLSDQAAAGGAGLGLAICKEIMVNLGGDIIYLPGQGGAAFRVTFPEKIEPKPET